MTRKLVETSCHRGWVMGVPTSRKTAGLATAHKSRVNAAQTSDKQDCLSHRVLSSSGYGPVAEACRSMRRSMKWVS